MRDHFVVAIEEEAMRDGESVAQGRCEHAGSRGGAHERKGVEGNADGATVGALIDDNVDDVVLHRGIEAFLHDTAHPVDLVNEKDVALLEVGEQSGKVGAFLENRAGGMVDFDPHLVRDDVRERRLAQARRAIEQHVVEGLAALTGGLDGEKHLIDNEPLPCEFADSGRTQGALDESVLPFLFRGDQSRVFFSCGV